MNGSAPRTTMFCYFCGGRVVSIGPSKKAVIYRCEAEGIRWDASENLVIYGRGPASVGGMTRRRDAF